MYYIVALLLPASRMLRRKIPQTGHLMTPRRLWIQTVPTQVSTADHSVVDEILY